MTTPSHITSLRHWAETPGFDKDNLHVRDVVAMLDYIAELEAKAGDIRDLLLGCQKDRQSLVDRLENAINEADDKLRAENADLRDEIETLRAGFALLMKESQS
jgi:hypothetical protein